MKWIKVSERLPKEGGQYIVRYRDGHSLEASVVSITMANVDYIKELFNGWKEWLDESIPDWKAALAYELRYDNYDDLNTDTQFVAEWMAKKLSGK